MKRILIAILGTAALLSGCAAANTAAPTVTTVNQSITEGIASAGAAATTAEQLYAAGSIPQTPAARTAINTLGTAYNDARAAYLLYLNAETLAAAAQNTQLAACQPATTTGGTTTPSAAASGLMVNGQPLTCAAATTSATAAQSQITTSLTALNARVATMTAATATVQSLSKSAAAK